jgi:hypothetical protein
LQAQDGEQTEQQVVAEANAADEGGGAAATPVGAVAQSEAAPAAAPVPVAAPAATPAHRGPVTIALGQTPDEVVAMKGQPLNKVNLGAKTICVYSDMKIIFMRDKVSDVQ